MSTPPLALTNSHFLALFPQQYEALSGKTAAPAAVAAAASSSSSASPSSAPVAAAMAAPAGAGAGGSLAAPMTPPPKTTQRQASHNRTASGVSIPELTLTTDDDTLSGRAASGAPRPLTPRDQPGGTTSKAPFNEVDYHSSPSSANPVSTGITRLHHSKIGSVDFWEGLRAWLESQLITPASPALGGEATMAGSPLASPGGGAAASTGGRDQVRGEAELIRLWEDFFQSQKPHLSASDVAKVRDGVGMFGWH